jgi:ribosome modulation factor
MCHRLVALTRQDASAYRDRCGVAKRDLGRTDPSEDDMPGGGSTGLSRAAAAVYNRPAVEPLDAHAAATPEQTAQPAPSGKRLSRMIRAATWIGTALGRWRQRQQSVRDDAFVDAWKAAWEEGYKDRTKGAARELNPYRRDPRRAAWLAGWVWADSVPRSTGT